MSTGAHIPLLEQRFIHEGIVAVNRCTKCAAPLGNLPADLPQSNDADVLRPEIAIHKVRGVTVLTVSIRPQRFPYSPSDDAIAPCVSVPIRLIRTRTRQPIATTRVWIQ